VCTRSPHGTSELPAPTARMPASMLVDARYRRRYSAHLHPAICNNAARWEARRQMGRPALVSRRRGILALGGATRGLSQARFAPNARLEGRRPWFPSAAQQASSMSPPPFALSSACATDTAPARGQEHLCALDQPGAQWPGRCPLVSCGYIARRSAHVAAACSAACGGPHLVFPFRSCWLSS
jgi:hypothetical protein